MTVTAIRTDNARSQRARLMLGVTWRNFVAGLVARFSQRIAWLLRPKQIPKQPIGNRSRNGHLSSFGRRMSSKS